MNKRVALAVSGLAAITVVGGSFAYFNATQTFNNPFSTTSFAASSVEKFNPNDGENWKPGVKVDKVVTAKNTGDGDVWVRIKFDEKWSRGEGDNSVFKEWGSSDGEAFNAASVAEGKQESTEDGVVTNDLGSVVYKTLNVDDWTYSNGYYYYKTTLSSQDTTKELLSDVTLCGDTDMGARVKDTYWVAVDKGADMPAFDLNNLGKWTKFVGNETLKDKAADTTKDYYTYTSDTVDPAAKGYADADYMLNITTEFVQADQTAAEAFSTVDAEKWTYYAAAGTTTQTAK